MGFRHNYHGGRTYAAGPDDDAGFAGWLRSKLKFLFRQGSPTPGAAASPARRKASPYSVLGADEPVAFPPHSGRPVFPMADWGVRPTGSLRGRRSIAPAEATDAEHPRP